MKKTFTLFKSSFQLLTKGAIIAAFGLMFFASDAYAQYTQPWHYYGCGYSNGGNNFNSYAAIEEVTIEDGSGNVVFSKTADACNSSFPQLNTAGSHYNVVTAGSAFTVSAGATYTITIGASNPNSVNRAAAVGVWMDYNADQDFADGGEFVSPANWLVPSGGSNSFNFTVPCGGTSGTIRMRIRSNLNFYTWTANEHSTQQFQAYYGETEDYECDYSVPSGLNASFFAPDTAFVGTVTTLVNANQSGYSGHWWDIGDDGSVDYTTTNANHVFGTTGTFTVKLKSENCNGVDSVTKSIVIISPTAPPVADFITTKNQVEIFDNFQCVDLSTNGATYWNWQAIMGSDTIDGTDQPDMQGGNPFIHQNPFVYSGTNIAGFPKLFLDEGMWTICLQSSNSIGSSSVVCKTQYVEVVRTSYSIGPETSLPANIIGAASGTLYDQGGQNGDYLAPTGNLEALIAPCGASSVSLDFSMFKLNANATLKIYDGTNALGTALHTGSGFTAGNAPSGTLTASSGTMYLLFNSTAGGTDSGFAATWNSVAGTGAAPIASFDLPADTIYNAVFEDFINTSQNAEGNVGFEWSINGSIVGTGRDLLNQIFLTNGSYTISLKVIACDGRTSTSTQTLIVSPPSSPTDLDFTADNRRPAAGDEITLTATSDKANRWEWQMFPPTGWAPTGVISNAIDTRTFQFNSPGVYAVQCKGYNSVDSTSSTKTVVKTAYIIVVEHCVPVVSVTTSEDVGISNVKLTEVSTGMEWENPSATGVAYEDFTGLGNIDVNFGGTYDFEISRKTNTNVMNRKIWVDWNVDGDFMDAGELVATEAAGTSMTWSGSMVVPDASVAFEANTIMRIGVSYGTDMNEPCGANSHPSANRIGEFEDYSLRVVNDGDDPTITLNGADTVYIQQAVCPTPGPDYVSLGATALDPSQGNISGDIVVSSDVDQCLTGVYYEQYNVTDASGNTAQEVTRVVYVVIDQTAPVITLNGNATETIEVGTTWVDAGATALDNKDGNLTGAIIVTGAVDANTLGTYTVTYTVQDNQGNSSSVTRTVTVVDTELPVIDNANADKTGTPWIVEVQLQSVFVDVTKATDNYNSVGNNLAFTANPGLGFEASVDTRFQGTTSVTYTATDESGNAVSQDIDYVVRDYIPPVIDLNTLPVVYHPVNNLYTPVDATATDNLYDNTQVSLALTSSNVNPFVLGTYQDVYTATDASGNTSTKTRTVHVIDDEKPTISGKTGDIITVGVGSQFSTLEDIVFSDNYDAPADLKANVVVVSNDINVWQSGLYSVTYRTFDNSGNQSNDYSLLVNVTYDLLPASVDELSLSDLLKVTPNPSTGLFNISVDLPENEEIAVGVYNTVGQQIVDVVSGSVSQGNYQVDITGQANGIYYVRMAVQGTIVTKKVVLNK